MSWYDDDFYNEPSEFDMLVGEFKESLMKSVKESYVKEMEQLKKENEELKEFRKERQNYSNELARIKSEYEEKEKHLEYKVKQERFGELLKGICETGWYAERCVEIYLPKCDKCDRDRRIHFKSPAGKDMTEPCSCSASRFSNYFNKELSLSMEGEMSRSPVPFHQITQVHFLPLACKKIDSYTGQQTAEKAQKQLEHR